MENNLYKPYENIIPIQPAKYRCELDVEKETVTYIRDDENGNFLYDAGSDSFYPENLADLDIYYEPKKNYIEFRVKDTD